MCGTIAYQLKSFKEILITWCFFCYWFETRTVAYTS